MKIESLDAKATLRMEYVECETQYYPSICFAVAVMDNDYRGANDEVWYEEDKFKHFIDQLRAFFDNQEVNTELVSMSEDVVISLQKVKNTDLIYLSYKISKLKYVGTYPVKLTVHGAFEFGLPSLTKMIEEFQLILLSMNGGF